MGLVTNLFLISSTIAVAWVFFQLTKPRPVPVVQDEYWGPTSDQGKPEDTSIRPFKIDISSTVLNDLKQRLTIELSSNRVPEPLEGTGFEYGFNSNYLKTVGNYWLHKYDWKTREKLLNKYPQFKTQIGGLDIHFYHVKPPQKRGKATRPILIVHGWPGSVVEFQKLIPLLSEPANSNINYELVIPSIPGYGFSSGPSRPGLGTVQIANIFKQLMDRLGHKEFYVMGGDWGAWIVADIATLYQDRILGAHSANCLSNSPTTQLKNLLASTFPSVFVPPEVAKHILPFWGAWAFTIREGGYAHIQQPSQTQSVCLHFLLNCVALSHSPLGLAAYILEKFSTWTNRSWITRQDGGITENFTLDELLDNVMIYWVTGSITTSMRLYAEALTPSRDVILDDFPTNVPFDCFTHPEEILIIPEFAVNQKYTNIKRFTIAKKGGHFGAFEYPQQCADDAISFFNSLYYKL